MSAIIDKSKNVCYNRQQATKNITNAVLSAKKRGRINNYEKTNLIFTGSSYVVCVSCLRQ